MGASGPSSAWQAALDGIYADPNFGEAAVWTPSGGAARGITVIVDMADANALVSGIGRQVFARRVFKARWSELAALSPTVAPAKGDTILYAGEVFRIVNQPERLDPYRLEWTLECG